MRCWVLGVGCWVLGVGCWVLGVGCSAGKVKNTRMLVLLPTEHRTSSEGLTVQVPGATIRRNGPGRGAGVVDRGGLENR